MEWQPIETAPMDGTYILIYQHNKMYADYEHTIYVAKYRTDYLNNPEWVEAMGEEYICFDPTHWMPLPKPPEGK